MEAPKLSAVIVAGPGRDRAQVVIDRLSDQTIAEQIEIVVVDIARGGRPLSARGVAPFRVVQRPGEKFARARIEGARVSRAPVVAFVEDHCLPDREWAEALVEAHEGPWVAVGFGFYNANPSSYGSRAAMMTDYGWWIHSVERGPAKSMASHNLSYKRDFLLSFGEDLELLTSPDQVLLEILGAKGVPMFIETRARAGHWNITSIPMLLMANFAFGRLHAAHRARARKWSPARRALYAAALCPIAPAVRFYRFARSLEKREALLELLETAPAVAAAYAFSSAGAAAGYLLGPGGAEDAVEHFDMRAEREPIR